MKKNSLLLVTSLILCAFSMKAQVLVNWDNPEQHHEAEKNYFKQKEALFAEFEEEVRRIQYNARILGVPTVDLLRERIDNLYLEAESMVRITIRETNTPFSKREEDIRLLRKKAVLLQRELDRLR